MGTGCCKTLHPTFKFVVTGKKQTLVDRVFNTVGDIDTEYKNETNTSIQKGLVNPWSFGYIELYTMTYTKGTVLYCDGTIVVLDGTANIDRAVDLIAEYTDSSADKHRGSRIFLIVTYSPIDILVLQTVFQEPVEWIKSYVCQIHPDEITWDNLSDEAFLMLVNRC